MYLNTMKLLQYNRTQNFLLVVYYTRVNISILILRRVTCGTLVTLVHLSQNVLRQLQVTG